MLVLTPPDRVGLGWREGVKAKGKWIDEREKGKFQDLHRSIKACDEVLKSVESYLYSFQTDLGVVSAEIETLQNRSTMLNKRLENRRVGSVIFPKGKAWAN